MMMGDKVGKMYSNQVVMEVSNFDITFRFAQRNGQANIPQPEDIITEMS